VSRRLDSPNPQDPETSSASDSEENFSLPSLVPIEHQALSMSLPKPLHKKAVEHLINSKLSINATLFLAKSNQRTEFSANFIIKPSSAQDLPKIKHYDFTRTILEGARFKSLPPPRPHITLTTEGQQPSLQDLHYVLRQYVKDGPISISQITARIHKSMFFVTLPDSSWARVILDDYVIRHGTTTIMATQYLPKKRIPICSSCHTPGHKQCHTKRCSRCGNMNHQTQNCPQADYTACINCGDVDHKHTSRRCPSVNKWMEGRRSPLTPASPDALGSSPATPIVVSSSSSSSSWSPRPDPQSNRTIGSQPSPLRFTPQPTRPPSPQPPPVQEGLIRDLLEQMATTNLEIKKLALAQQEQARSIDALRQPGMPPQGPSYSEVLANHNHFPPRSNWDDLVAHYTASHPNPNPPPREPPQVLYRQPYMRQPRVIPRPPPASEQRKAPSQGRPPYQ
jgi:hypothetical protein